MSMRHRPVRALEACVTLIDGCNAGLKLWPGLDPMVLEGSVILKALDDQLRLESHRHREVGVGHSGLGQ